MTEITPLATYSDKEFARVVLGDQCKPTSWKSIQAAIRKGDLKARRVGRYWRILGQDGIDYLSYRNGRR